MNDMNLKEKTLVIRDTVLGDGKPKICVPLAAENRQQLEEQIGQLLQVPFDMAEFRVDFYDEHDAEEDLEGILGRIRERIGEKLLLVTYRTDAEGGEKPLAYGAYKALNLRAAASGAADLIDLELFTVLRNEGTQEKAADLVRAIQDAGCRVIGSSHDFRETPETEEMIRRLVLMQKMGMDVTKLAVMPRTRQDTVRLLDASVQMWENYADRPFVTMSMGRTGAVSRVIGGFSGSAVTFATAARASAPGQIPAQTMAQLLGLIDGMSGS